MNNQKISILIIDSEQKTLDHALKLLCTNPLVSKIEAVPDTDQAILKIINFTFDIILLDYPSKGNAEKELITFAKSQQPEPTLIFVSNTKEYAVHAIQNGIFKYLLKPIDSKEFKKIINAVHKNKQSDSRLRFSQIIESTPEETRLRLQTKKGYLMLNPEEIIFCKAAGFYTELYLTKDRVELSSQFLFKFEEMLTQFNFLRVSRSHLINQNFIRKVHKTNNMIVLWAEGKEIEVKAGRVHIKNLSKFDTE
jgi:two-component system, LytTR family, response regulator